MIGKVALTRVGGYDPDGLSKRVTKWIEEAHDGKVIVAAKAVGIPNSTLWQIKKGTTRSPGHEVLVKLSQAMGCTIDFLITGE